MAAPVADLGGLEPLAILDQVVFAVAGVVIAVAGVTTTLLAQWAMGDSWRIGVAEGERTDLVTSGAFQIVRNPIFTAMSITSVGLTLMVPNAVAITGLGALLIALQLQVRVVEVPSRCARKVRRISCVSRSPG
ncbi:methyltransferase family protein [Actinomadura sp. HBU206391]|uniref:methyltransferase family protein n=1 Tax=Actinomadura sp. HBU206391 TaxID=2731692 RepID=UPI0016501AF3|nr:methyltransferase [Actinomadura sp. HBU206391]MBC6458992.1 hypothetical protein [Actinomadura sp. HBU206391]